MGKRCECSLVESTIILKGGKKKRWPPKKKEGVFKSLRAIRRTRNRHLKEKEREKGGKIFNTGWGRPKRHKIRKKRKGVAELVIPEAGKGKKKRGWDVLDRREKRAATVLPE